MLKDFELYHGAVIIQILRNPGKSIKLFEKSPDYSWSEYEISDNLGNYKVFIKSTSNVTRRKNNDRCNFTFSSADIARLKDICETNVIICLVCEKEAICTLTWEDVDELGFLRSKEQCSLSVSWTKGSSLSVKCQGKELSHKIARNRLEKFEWV